MANIIEKVKPIILTIGDKTYTLEFNRNSVVSAERAGLDLEQIKTAPTTTIPLLFFAAFRMHHPEVTQKDTDKILLETLHGLKPEEIQRLGELYAAPTNALLNTSEDDGDRKNVTISL